MVFNQVFIQMYFTPEDFFYVFIRLLSQVFIRDAPGISEKDENRSKSTKVTRNDIGVSIIQGCSTIDFQRLGSLHCPIHDSCRSIERCAYFITRVFKVFSR